MIKFKETSTVRPSANILSSTLSDDDVIVLNIGIGSYSGLKKVGATVWKHLQASPRTIEELVELIRAEYDVPVARCRTDIEALVSDLLSEGLVTLKNASS